MGGQVHAARDNLPASLPASRAVAALPLRGHGVALESKALCLEKPCPQQGDLTSRKLGVVEGSQWTQSVLLDTTVLFLLLTPLRVCCSSEEERGAGCLASEGVPCLPCPALPAPAAVCNTQLAFGKSSALAQRPRLPKSSSSIEFGPWILITLHCAGNESQWSQ